MSQRFLRLIVVTLTAAGAACATPELPEVPAVPERQHIADDDRAVMVAVLDRFRNERSERSQRERGLATDQPLRTDAIFLLLDSTVCSCAAEITEWRGPAHNPPPIVQERLARDDLWHRPASYLPALREVSWAFANAREEQMLDARNRRTYAITGNLGDDVVRVPWTALDAPRGYSNLVGRYPRSSQLVALSAPAYPTLGTALIWYRWWWNGWGIVRLEYTDGLWSVESRVGTTE